MERYSKARWWILHRDNWLVTPSYEGGIFQADAGTPRCHGCHREGIKTCWIHTDSEVWILTLQCSLQCSWVQGHGTKADTLSTELAGPIAQALFSFEVASESEVSVQNQLFIPAAIMQLTCSSVDFSEYSKACFFLMQILFLLLYLSLKYRKLHSLLGWHS